MSKKSNLEDIYIRIHLDSTNTVDEYKKVADAADLLQKRLKDLTEAAKRENRDPSKDPTIQMVTRELQVADSIYKTNRQFYADTQDLVKNLAKATLSELQNGARVTERMVRNLTREGADAAQIEEMRRRNALIHEEMDRRDVRRRDLATDIKNITNLTAEQLKKCVQESELWMRSLPKGSAEMRQMLNYYLKFSDQQAKVNGEMTRTRAYRLAGGSAQGSMEEMKEASKYLEKLRDDYGQFMGASTRSTLDRRITGIGDRSLSMARSIASGQTLASQKDMVAALDIIKNKWRSLDPTIQQNQTLIRELGREYSNLKFNIEQWGRTTMTKQDASNTLAKSLQLIQQGTNASANEIRYYAERLKLAQNAEGITIQNLSDINAAYKQMQAMLRQTGEAMHQQANEVALDAATILGAEADAERLIAQGQAAHVGELRTTIDLYKQMVAQEDISVEKRDAYLRQLKQMEAQMKGNTEAIRDKIAVESEADKLIDEGTGADILDVRKTIADLEALRKQQGITAGEAVRYAEKIEKLRNLMRGTSTVTREVAYDQLFVNDTMQNLSTTPYENLKKAAAMLEKELKKAQRGTKDFIDKSNRLGMVRDEMRKVEQATKGVNEQLKAQESIFSRSLGKLVNYLGLFGGFYLVREKVQEAFEANKQFDESLSNIRKTTGMAAESVAILTDNIKRIDTRTSLQSMTDLAYAAGRLGVKGVSDVLGFVRAADEIKVALGEQLGDNSEAIEQLMKVSSIMGVQDQYGLEEGIRRIGSSINYLSQNSQATAQPMVNFMKRVAGISTQAGITASELAGLSAAVSALGQPVEMSATSFSKMMVQIVGHSQQVAEALKLSAEETTDFMYQIDSGQAMDAFLTVLRKVNELGGLSQLTSIVKDLGGSGARVVQTLSTLAENYQMVSEYVYMSNDAFKQGTSVTSEYELKQKNLGALWEKMKNRFANLFVSSEAIDFFRDILLQLQDLPKAAEDFVRSMGWVRDVFGWLASTVIQCTSVVSGFVKAMALNAVVIKARNGIMLLRTNFNNLTTAIHAASGGMQKFKTVLASASFSNIFTAAFAVIFMTIDAISARTRETNKQIEDSIEALERAHNQFAATTAGIDVLISKIQLSVQGTDERKRLLEEINRTYGEYLGHQVTDADNNIAIVESLRQVNAELRVKALLEGREQMMADIDKKYSTERGEKKQDLVKNVAKSVKLGDKSSPAAANAVAADVVARLLELQADGTRFGASLLRQTKGDDGFVEKYNLWVWDQYYDNNAGYNTAYVTIQNLLRNAINEYNANHTGTNLELSGGYIDDILVSLKQYLNTEVKRDKDKRTEAAVWDMDLQDASKKAAEGVTKSVNEYWSAIKNTVTQGNKFKTEYVSEDINAKDKEPWRMRKESLSNQERVEEVRMVRGFLNRIDDYMRNEQSANRRFKPGMPEVEANETDEFKELRARQYNAQQYLRVLSVGKISVEEEEGEEEEKKEKEVKKPKPARATAEDYKNIIAKIKEFYEIQQQVIEQQRADGELSPVSYARALKQNEVRLNLALASARDAIDGDDIGERVWNALKRQMRQENIGGAEGEEVLDRIDRTGQLRSMGIKLNGGTDDDKAIISGMKKEAESNRLKMKQIATELTEEVYKAWMEQNPLGKISSQFFDELETMGLMLADFTATAREESSGLIFDEQTGEYIEQYARSLSEFQQDVMNAYRKIGESVSQFDINTKEGIEKFRQYVSLFPDLAEQAAHATDLQLRGIYYKSYEYAEQMSEQSKRLADRSMKMWERMFQQTLSHQTFERFSNDIEALKKHYQELQRFGLNDEFIQVADIGAKQAKYQDALAGLAFRSQRAYAHLSAAEALNVGDTDADGRNITSQFRESEIASAQAEIEQLKGYGEEVMGIYGELLDAQMALRQNTWDWLAELTDVTTKLMDAFVPLRSYYDDKGSFAENVFGTKAERQEAFGAFIDDVKRTVRKAMMEQAKLWMLHAMGIDEKGAAWVKGSKDAAQNEVNSTLVSGKTMELDQQKALNEAQEAEERRHVEEMRRIQGGDVAGDGGVTAAEEVAEARIAAEEASTKAALKGAQQREDAEKHWSLTSWLGIDKLFKRRKKSIAEDVQAQQTAADTRVTTEQEAAAQVGITEKTLGQMKVETAQTATAAVVAASETAKTEQEANSIEETSVSMWGSFGAAVSRAWAEGGPFLGPILAAVVSAAVGSLMTMVFNMMGSSKKTPDASSARLVSQMLTYDSGNVQSFGTTTSGAAPVMGDDGRVYMVQQADTHRSGMANYTGLLTRPTLTRIGGLPALVAEQGPEMVIGRETTRAMQLSRPDLLRAIVEFDRNRSRGFAKTFDQGNLPAADISATGAEEPMTQEQMMAVLDAATAAMNDMAAVNARLTAEIARGIGVRRNDVVREVAAGFVESRRLKNDDNVNRLFRRS